MNGSSTPNAPATYGTMFIPSPANTPAGMYKPFGWTDHNGNFWIFGGYNSQSFQCYSDLWKFDPLSDQWTWMGGTGLTNSSGVYGTQGVPAPGNCPGARFRGYSWTDNSGNLWLFGGFGYDVNGQAGKLNDLWKFDIITGEWTWMKGANTINAAGSYGTIGIASMSNEPQSRDECSVAWTSQSGDLWLFGGQGTTGYLNDVWRYSLTTNMWTWMSGLNTINNPPIYGAYNTSNPANTPGSRSAYARWTDSNGKFWMFGGNVNANLYNDIWLYDPVINEWTWKGGVAFGNGAANYGPSCEANNYNPSSRTETLCTWKDSCDRMWFMGGNNTNLLSQSTSDVWFFDPSILQYTLVCGTAAINQPGNFGTQLVPSPSNYPTSNCGSLGFTDNSGNFWLFCGLLDASGNNTNAMWKYTRPQYCPQIIFTINASDT
ncbi:MAG TPA: kelch repeat-containing protein, partial [Bacteroidia bacterium]|nr:kelch repeat-containing protein [Bacteroidia bacterium]